ncbi:hypothetical protein H4N58_14500 [Mumia sp. ZJ1417]|uniref:hypothetical protein n=1 Tax=unclassified Mumia TaxID=2621872 RepID=UPI00142415A6|nr:MULTISPECIES: hypothetical protein [unclassified Mumia]QMW65404.1 hypothetical protein H4N58_14500 [Mumia sp. ZJ1417]
MTHISADAAGIHLEFPGWERWMAGRSAFTAPLDAIVDTSVEPGWTSEILGIRSGLVVSGYLKVGTFRHPSGVRRLVSMRRGQPLLRVALDRGTTGFDELLLSSPDAAAIAQAIDATAHHHRY